MKVLIQSGDAVCQWWLTGMERACWQGGFALALVWVLCRLWPRLPARAKSWLWRLAFLKLLVALFCPTTIDLPLLPSRQLSSIRRDSQIETFSAPKTVKALEESSLPPLRPTARFTPPNLSSGLVFFWMLAVVWRISGLFSDWQNAKKLRRDSKPVRDAWLIKHCEELCGRLGLVGAPQVLKSDKVSGPALVGVRHPAIILPGSLFPDSLHEEIKLMVAHELAHLKRRDLWWIALPLAGEVLFFFHPLIWLAKREWRLNQEVACDEIAVRLENVPARKYGDMLILVARNLTAPPRANFNVVGVIETKQTLERRLVAMKSIRQKPGWSVLLSAATLLVIGGLGILPWRAVSQETEQNQPPQKPKSTQTPGLRRAPSGSAPREVLDAQRNLAVTELQIAESELARNKELVDRGRAPDEVLDASKIKLAQARVHLAEAESSIKESRLASQSEAPEERETGGRVIRISSPRPGVVEKIFVRVGTKVKKGDSLLALNSESEKAGLRVAQAMLEVAKAQVRVPEIEAKDAARAAGTGTISKFEIEAAESRRAIARAQVNVAESHLAQAEVELNQLTLRAPRQGVILKLNIREGEYTGLPSESPLIVIAEDSEPNQDAAMNRDAKVSPLTTDTVTRSDVAQASGNKP